MGTGIYPRNTFWTDERDAELRRLQADRCSAGVIAGALGTTRNAVIGRLRRIGLSPLSQASGGSHIYRLRSLHSRAQRIVAPPEMPPAEAVADLPIDQSPFAVSIFQHREGLCKWPLNATTPIHDHLWCGAAVVVNGCPYCARHFAVSRNKRAA
jgi:hypothetical protein